MRGRMSVKLGSLEVTDVKRVKDSNPWHDKAEMALSLLGPFMTWLFQHHRCTGLLGYLVLTRLLYLAQVYAPNLTRVYHPEDGSRWRWTESETKHLDPELS